MSVKSIPIGVLGVSAREFIDMLEEGFELDLPQLSDYDIGVIIIRLIQIKEERKKWKNKE